MARATSHGTHYETSRADGLVTDTGAGRQPVHTLYGGAHLFRANTAARVGELARAALDEYAPDAATFAAATGVDLAQAAYVYERVRAKLTHEPVEDYRIDFEDGYGHRPDADEDRDATHAATELARGYHEKTLPTGVGIRIKPLNAELGRRSLRTLDAFVATLARASGAPVLPVHFVVTIPKVTAPDQVVALVEALSALERREGLDPRSIPIEVMIEAPQLVVDATGRSALGAVRDAADGRLRGVHFGPYDYTAACGITADHQHPRHPAAMFAKCMMQVAYAGTGVWLADGPTMVLPVPPHRPEEGRSPSIVQRRENATHVHRAWRMHYEDVRHSLIDGFYQSWDLHPAQLPSRYAAVYAFFLDGLAPAAERLRNFLDHAAQATRLGGVFDDAATGQGLLNYFLRALHSGAITEQEAVERSGLTVEELLGKSFSSILANRSHDVS